jgi:NADH:ubiquinone oxidoreductase subunit 6 (subunit J)
MPPSTLRLIGLVLLAVLGGAGVYLLLPKPRPHSILGGGVLALLALITFGVLLGPIGLSPESFLFSVFSAIAVVSGCLLITQRNPARAALSFALVVLSSCGLFLLLAAPFLMAATLIIYAGAIIVTFLFVLMLAQQEGPSDADARSREPLWSAFAGAGLLATLLYILGETYNPVGLQQLDEQLQRLSQVDREGAKRTAEDATTTLRQVEQQLHEFQNWVDQQRGDVEDRAARPAVLPDGGKQLGARITEASVQVATEVNNVSEGKPVAWDKVHGALVAVRRAGLEARQTVGMLQVPESLTLGGQPKPLPLSAYSGPATNLPPDSFRRDDQGRPALPAENVRYLGRSLFTDYLLPVELGGTLLLVATIGAIAIATRRAERLS